MTRDGRRPHLAAINTALHACQRRDNSAGDGLGEDGQAEGLVVGRVVEDVVDVRAHRSPVRDERVVFGKRLGHIKDGTLDLAKPLLDVSGIDDKVKADSREADGLDRDEVRRVEVVRDLKVTQQQLGELDAPRADS